VFGISSGCCRDLAGFVGLRIDGCECFAETNAERVRSLRRQPRLLQALVAVYGPVDGRGATVDALSWAWEHWDRLQEVENKPAYLFRVGQSATRRYSTRPLPC
jgi:hypothetical protein